jgi:hypothetical protein
MKKMHVNELWVQTAHERPEHYDFSENKRWEDWDIPFSLTEEEEQNEEFNPMMNYFYPLPNFEDQKRYRELDNGYIKDAVDEAGSLTLVKKLKYDEYGLALTGGGMDLSWDICRGYINLGYLPPLHFCEDLPEESGEDYNKPRNRIVLEACKRSAKMVEDNAKRALAKLNQDYK